MTDTDQAAEPRTYWFETQHTNHPDGQGPWETCYTVALSTTDYTSLADMTVAEDDSTPPKWTRVHVWADADKTGEPLFSTWPRMGGNGKTPSTATDPVVPPDAEPAQGGATNVLPFPPSQATSPTDGAQAGMTGPDLGKGDPLTLAGKLGMSLEGDGTRRFYMLVKDIDEAAPNNPLSIIARSIRDAKVQAATSGMIEYAKLLEAAIGHAKEVAATEGLQTEWYNTEFGCSVVAHSASGFVAAFTNWKLQN